MIGQSVRAADELSSTIRFAAERRQDDVIELLQTLVRYRSENPKLVGDAERAEAGRSAEAACQDFMAEQLRAMSMTVDRFEALPRREDVVGVAKGTGGGRSLILNGHIDVVPVGNPRDWPRDPWGAEIDGGKLWGRGSCDMKGGVAAGLAALWVLKDAGIKLAGDIVFESVVDEETGGPGTRAAIDRGYRADAAIVLEPTSGALVPVQGGLFWANVIVRGIGGHSGARYRSIHARGQGRPVNAIEKAGKILVALQELERHWANSKVHPLMPPNNTINPGMIAGGTGEGPNKLPSTFNAYANMADYCIIGLDIKYLPNERPEDVRREFEDFLAAVARTDPWLSQHPPEVEWEAHGLHFPPCDTSLEHPLLVSAADAYRTFLGEPKWSGYEAVTDLGFLAAAGIPGLIYGPGSIARSHGSDEYIELEDLRSSVNVLALTISRYCGVS